MFLSPSAEDYETEKWTWTLQTSLICKDTMMEGVIFSAIVPSKSDFRQNKWKIASTWFHFDDHRNWRLWRRDAVRLSTPPYILNFSLKTHLCFMRPHPSPRPPRSRCDRCNVFWPSERRLTHHFISRRPDMKALRASQAEVKYVKASLELRVLYRHNCCWVGCCCCFGS